MKIYSRITIIFLIILFTPTIYYFFPDQKLSATLKPDKIIILKAERKLLLISGTETLKTYKISLGRNPIGAKHFEGDDKTPEGQYYIESKNPNSDFYLNLGISYPNEKDLAFAKKTGKSPGGLIKIHGLKNGLGYIGKFQRLTDWTHGCIALTNNEMKELYENIKIGTPIEIKP